MVRARGSGPAHLSVLKIMGRRKVMRSDCIAALPQSTCSYTWKLPVTPHMRPVLFDQVQSMASRDTAHSRPNSAKQEIPSIPWKTYLASRELHNLALDLADAVFSPISQGHSSSEAERPGSLNASALTGADKPSAGSLLASVLPEDGDASRNNADKQTSGFALAA